GARTRCRQRYASQHGDHGASRRSIRLHAAREPRRAFPLRPSGRGACLRRANHDDTRRGDRGRRSADRTTCAAGGASHDRLTETLVMTPASLLHPDAFLSPLAIDEAVHRALDEDLGRAGDITSLATIPEANTAHAILVARQTGVIAGLPLALATLQQLSDAIEVQAHVRDGAKVK